MAKPGTAGFLADVTTPWLDHAVADAGRLGLEADPVELRLGVAVIRGLLIDALAGPEAAAAATASLERFIQWFEAAARGG
jgi:hypothetical protein